MHLKKSALIISWLSALFVIMDVLPGVADVGRDCYLLSMDPMDVSACIRAFSYFYILWPVWEFSIMPLKLAVWLSVVLSGNSEACFASDFRYGENGFPRIFRQRPWLRWQIFLLFSSNILYSKRLFISLPSETDERWRGSQAPLFYSYTV